MKLFELNQSYLITLTGFLSFDTRLKSRIDLSLAEKSFELALTKWNVSSHIKTHVRLVAISISA